jgi:hypothetical protein
MEQRKYEEAWEDGSRGSTQVHPLCDGEGDYLSPHCIGGSM